MVELERSITLSIEWYKQTININPSQAAFIGRLEDLPSFPPNPHAFTLGSSDATNSSAVRIPRDRAYNLSVRTAHWLHGRQLELPGASSSPNSQSINHPRLPSNPRGSVVDPVVLESFAPCCGLEPHEFVEPNNKWVSSVSPTFPPRRYPQVSREVWVSTSSRDRQSTTAEQNKLLWQNDGEFPGRPFPSFIDLDLTEFKDPRQGTKSSGDHTNSMQDDWMGGIVSDGPLDFEDHRGVDQEVLPRLRSISKNAVNIKKFAPFLAVASTAMTIRSHKANAPHADLAHTAGTGKFGTSRVRKALPRKERHQELAVTQHSGSCFRCKFARESVRAYNYLKYLE